MSELEKDFEKLLDKEAERIAKKLLELYEKKVEVNKSMNELIIEFAKKRYKYFSLDLWLRIPKMLPNNLEEDRSYKYALATKEENRIHWLNGYSNYCKYTKNHKMASKQIANNIIKQYNKNKNCAKDLIELVVENMPKVLPEHHDSVDCFTIMMYLQKDILDLGYVVVNTAPLRLATNN